MSRQAEWTGTEQVSKPTRGLLRNALVARLVSCMSIFNWALELDLNLACILSLAGYQITTKARFHGKYLAPSSSVGDNATVSHLAHIGPQCSIGEHAIIGSDSRLYSNVTLGIKSKVGGRCSLERIEIGMNTHICSEVLCIGNGKGNIKIGKECYIGPRCLLDWSDNLTIGDCVHVAGPSTVFWTHSSIPQVLAGDNLDDVRKRGTAPTLIEDCVYVGSNCTVYPGVRIMSHSVVLANSVVHKDVPEGVMVGGAPAFIIKHLNRT